MLSVQVMAAEIERITGVPVVTLEYDGTGGFKNADVIPYLKYPRKRYLPEDETRPNKMIHAAG